MVFQLLDAQTKANSLLSATVREPTRMNFSGSRNGHKMCNDLSGIECSTIHPINRWFVDTARLRVTLNKSVEGKSIYVLIAVYEVGHHLKTHFLKTLSWPKKHEILLKKSARTRRTEWSTFQRDTVAHQNQKLSCFEVHQQNFKKPKSLFGVWKG
jgi:hypothetical protein